MLGISLHFREGQGFTRNDEVLFRELPSPTTMQISAPAIFNDVKK